MADDIRQYGEPGYFPAEEVPVQAEVPGLTEDILEAMDWFDSYTGAPARRAIYEAQKGRFAEIPGAVWRQFGAPTETAPTGYDIGEAMDIDEPYTQAAVSAAAEMADITGPLGAGVGMARKLKHFKQLKELGEDVGEVIPMSKFGKQRKVIQERAAQERKMAEARGEVPEATVSEASPKYLQQLQKEKVAKETKKRHLKSDKRIINQTVKGIHRGADAPTRQAIKETVQEVVKRSPELASHAEDKIKQAYLKLRKFKKRQFEAKKAETDKIKPMAEYEHLRRPTAPEDIPPEGGEVVEMHRAVTDPAELFKMMFPRGQTMPDRMPLEPEKMADVISIKDYLKKKD